MGVNAPVYVAGFERGVRPMGDWSTMIALFKYSRPSKLACAPGSSFAFQKYLMRARPKISLTKDDLPDPETPETHTNFPSGIETSICFRLCSRAPFTTKYFVSPFSFCFPVGRTAIFLFPERYSPVNVFDRKSSFGVPENVIRPPCFPAPGP